jgi:hypothetical protein
MFASSNCISCIFAFTGYIQEKTKVQTGIFIKHMHSWQKSKNKNDATETNVDKTWTLEFMVGKLSKNFLYNKVVNEAWKENFRLSKPNFMKLCNQLRLYIEKETTRFRKPLSVAIQVAITLYYIADEGRMQKMANAFGIAKCTVSVVVRFVTQIISNVMGDSIKLPKTEEQVKALVTEFYKQHGFPQCLGAVDGTHVPIKRPKENATYFINRKGRYSSIGGL